MHCCTEALRCNAQSPLDTFPRKFPVYWEVANLLRTG